MKKKTLNSLLVLLAAVAVFFANQLGLIGGDTAEPVSQPISVTQTVETQAPTTAPEAPTETAAEAPEVNIEVPDANVIEVTEDGEYSSRDEVAAYLNAYGHLPGNYITKKEAQKLGWVSNEGNLWKVAPGKSIGGDYFGNYEGNLPEAAGRDYHECDIDFDGKYRNAKRILYSNDGLIYYTDDHYETFTLLYGEES